MRTARRTIVMVHPGGLGDVLLAVPAMVRLRIHFPNHQLVLCAEDQVASHGRSFRGVVDRVIVAGARVVLAVNVRGRIADPTLNLKENNVR